MKLKRAASIALAGAMAMSLMAVPAFAETNSAGTQNTGKAYDVNVQNHTYKAYQIFKGTQAGVGQPLGNVEWGSGVDGARLLAALKDDQKIDGLDFSNCTTAQDVAKVLTGANTTDETLARAFAAVAYKFKTDAAAIDLGTESTTTIERTANTDGSVSYSGDGISKGYYLIEDTTDVTPGTDGKEDAKNLTVLQVANTITIKSKAQYPTIEKKILDPDEMDQNEASMGEDVKYELKSTVPDTKAYTEGYYFYMSDMQSKGLTLNESSFVVTVGDTPLEEDTDYTVVVEHSTDPANTIDYITTDADWPTAFEINFNDITKYTAGQTIKVTYKAELNKDAAIYPAANPNKVNLHYSNNPNENYGGERKPGETPKVPTGETPWDEVKTYTTGVKLQKTNGTGFTEALKDAEFTLKATDSSMKYSVVTTNAFTEDNTNGTYYKLKNGTYTTTASTEDTASQYASTTVKYTQKTTATVKGEGQDATDIKATVDGAGQIQFTGLGAGTYTLTETKTPAGYNTAAPVEFTISFTNDAANPTFTRDNSAVTFNGTTGLFGTTIVNNLGNTLPSTGGVGTRMFYVFGGCLVAAAAVLLALKKRREA